MNDNLYLTTKDLSGKTYYIAPVTADRICILHIKWFMSIPEINEAQNTANKLHIVAFWNVDYDEVREWL